MYNYKIILKWQLNIEEIIDYNKFATHHDGKSSQLKL